MVPVGTCVYIYICHIGCLKRYLVFTDHFKCRVSSMWCQLPHTRGIIGVSALKEEPLSIELPYGSFCDSCGSNGSSVVDIIYTFRAECLQWSQ